MQGLPFDEADFPPAVSVSSTWMDASPRFVPPAASAAANVTEEDLYGIGVPTPQQQSVPTSDVLSRYSQQIPTVTPASSLPLYAQQQRLQQQQHHIQIQPQSQPMPIPRHHPTQQPPIPSRMPSTAPPIQQQQQQPHLPQRRQRVPVSQPQQDTHKPPMQRSLPNIRTQQPPPTHHDDSSPINAIGNSTAPLPVQSKDNRKPVRSAVEEARLRAQHEAETFANSRRDPTKRECSYSAETTAAAAAIWEVPSERRSSKRLKSEVEHNSGNEGQSVRKSIKLSHERIEDPRAKLGDESEAEKQERYKRRLDMNRESAAVSRVRRRAYVKELEERLAAVEAEKLQLEGKLEVMQSQNESYKKQLDNLFMLVASGRRPTYENAPSDAS